MSAPRKLLCVVLMCVVVFVSVWSPHLAAQTVTTTAQSNSAPKLYGMNGRYVVAEGSAVGTVVGEIYATDAESDPLTFTLVGGVGFAVDVNTGVITVAVAPSRTDGTMRKLRVSVSDGVSNTVGDFQVFVTPAVPFATTGVTRETFTSVSGGSVADLRNAVKFKNNAPDATTVVNQLYLASQSVSDNFGQRYTGYIIPSVSGTFRFWVSSDDASELRISTSTDSTSLPAQAIADKPDTTTNFNGTNPQPSNRNHSCWFVGRHTTSKHSSRSGVARSISRWHGRVQG